MISVCCFVFSILWISTFNFTIYWGSLPSCPSSVARVCPSAPKPQMKNEAVKDHCVVVSRRRQRMMKKAYDAPTIDETSGSRACPADAEYWNDFYSTGEGSRGSYEWYGLSWPSLAPHLNRVSGLAAMEPSTSHLKEMLQLGVGSSPILQCWTALGAREHHASPTKSPVRQGRPSGVKLRNIDICSRVVDEMRERYGTSGVTEACYLCRRISSNTTCGFVAPTEWLTEDTLSLDSIEDNSCDVIFDKATLDALLSHGEDEQGETLNIQRLFACVLRKLKVGGKYLLISGNDPSIILPYVYGTEPVGYDSGDTDKPAWSMNETVELLRASSPNREDDGSLTRDKAAVAQPSFTGLQMRLYVLERLP